MQWYVNDLSLNGQFGNLKDFWVEIESLLALRARDSVVRNGLLISNEIFLRMVMPNVSLSAALDSIKDRDFRQRLMLWLGTRTFFWDESRQHIQDDYFEYRGQDVTNQGLGEATRRKIVGIEAASYSFNNTSGEFCRTPLQIQHGLVEKPYGFYQIDNLYNTENLKQSADSSRPAPANWEMFLEESKRRYSELIFSDDIYNKLVDESFSPNVVSRSFGLLLILNNLVIETSENNEFTSTGMEEYRKFFTGDKALFTDESDSNKHAFKKELTFKDPEERANTLFCSWHGKINNPKFRIHFEWPRPAGQRKIKIVYIGPKITKD